MPPRKKQEVSIAKLEEEMTNLNVLLIAVQEQASSGRTRHGGKNLMDMEKRVKLAEAWLKQAKLEGLALDAPSMKRAVTAVDESEPPSKRQKGGSLSDEEVLDMELGLLDERQAKEDVEAARLVKDEAEKARRQAKEDADTAARLAKEDAEKAECRAKEEAGEGEHLAKAEAEKAERQAKEDAEAARLVKKDTEAARLAKEEAEKAERHAKEEAEEGKRLAKAEAEKAERQAKEDAEAARLAKEDAARMIEQAERAGMAAAAEQAERGLAQHIINGEPDGRTVDGDEKKREEVKSTGRTSLGMAAAKLLLSFIDDDVRHKDKQVNSLGDLCDEDAKSQVSVQQPGVIMEGLYTMDSNGGEEGDVKVTGGGDGGGDLEMNVQVAKKSRGKAKGKPIGKIEVGSDAEAKAATKDSKKRKATDGDSAGGDVAAMLQRQKRYEEMPESEKRALINSGASQIHVWMKDPSKSITADIRIMLREVPDYLPQAAAVSGLLTLHILTTPQRNVRCLYHNIYRRMNKSDLDVDAAMKLSEKGELSLTGVSGKRVVGKERMLFRAEEVEDYEASHLDCGCGVDESLFHFWMWKTWRLHGVGGTVVEPISSIHITPRLRNVVYQGFTELAGLRSGMGLIFTGVLASDDENREHMLESQLRHLTGELAGLYRKRGEALLGDKVLSILMKGGNVRNIGTSTGEGSSGGAKAV